MSGLAGVLWRDYRPATVDDAARLLACLEHRGGAAFAAVRGSVAMGCRSQDGEAASDAPQALVTIDGCLDNQDELATLLDLPRESATAAFVERAWHKWGRDCPARFVGDFAFTISDGETVFAARDCAPFRPLYYRSTSRGTYWASELGPLVRHEPAPFNEGMVAEYLADRITTSDETLFTGVYRLPPAHAMEIKADGATEVWRYWQPNPRTEIRYRGQDEYDEHFRTLFREAVRCRLAGRRRVALWYSGGIDSSAIAAQIAELRDQAEPTIAQNIETVSIAARGYDFDESPHFTEGASYHRLANTVRPFHVGSYNDFINAAALSADTPPSPSMMGGRSGWKVMEEREVDSSLTGLGGDEWFIGSQFAFVDDVRTLRWRTAFARWRAERQDPFGFNATQLLKLGLWLHLPHHARSLVRNTFGWTAVPSHVAPDLATRVALDERLRAEAPSLPFRSFAQQQLYTWATGASAVVSGENYARMAARSAIETRHPFHDRRLVEFALALPPDQLLRPGTPRHIVLSAVLSRVPRAIYNHVSGVDYAPLMRDLLVRLDVRRRVEAALSDLPDWLEASSVREMARQVAVPNATDVARQMWALWQILAIHMWWQGLERPQARTTPCPKITCVAGANGAVEV